MNLQKELYEQLPHDKVKINWNKNPVKMDLFLSFLTVPLVKSTDHLGACTGWTLRKNESLKLEISGGIVGGAGEYLENIKFGTKLQNPYNNNVNPFYIFDILNDEGKAFFIDYYRSDIDKVVTAMENKITHHQTQLSFYQGAQKQLLKEVESLYNKAPAISK